MSAPKGNQFAAKPDSEVLAFQVHVRTTFAERKAWRDRARATGGSFNEWARRVLNREAGRPWKPKPTTGALPTVAPDAIVGPHAPTEQ